MNSIPRYRCLLFLTFARIFCNQKAFFNQGPTCCAKLLQTVRKLFANSIAARILRPIAAQSGKNHKKPLSARLYGAHQRVFARSAWRSHYSDMIGPFAMRAEGMWR